MNDDKEVYLGGLGCNISRTFRFCPTLTGASDFMGVQVLRGVHVVEGVHVFTGVEFC